ncbi:MAG: euchromatic histone-lysine N-methyltransferase 1b, partial [uncultured bacterium]
MKKRNRKTQKGINTQTTDVKCLYKELERINSKSDLFLSTPVVKNICKELEQVKAKSLGRQKKLELEGSSLERRKKILEVLDKEHKEETQNLTDSVLDTIGDLVREGKLPLSFLEDLLEEIKKPSKEVELKSYSNQTNGKHMGAIPLLVNNEEGSVENEARSVVNELTAKLSLKKQSSEPPASSQNNKPVEKVNYSIDDLSLMSAIAAGDTEVVSALLQPGRCEINKINIAGRTPLMSAVDGKHIEIVRMLLSDPNIDPNIIDDILGRTALMYAVIDNQAEIVKELLSSEKVDPNIKDVRVGGCTALAYATNYKHNNLYFPVACHGYI